MWGSIVTHKTRQNGMPIPPGFTLVELAVIVVVFTFAGIVSMAFNASPRMRDEEMASDLAVIANSLERWYRANAISAGANRGCATNTSYRTFCWGVGRGGQIGDGTTNDRRKPTESLFLRVTGNQYVF